MQEQQPIPTPGEIWKILKEVSASQKRLAEDRKRQALAWEKQRRDLAERQKKLDLAWEKPQNA